MGEVEVISTSKESQSMVSSVGMGGNFACDREGCGHFETNNIVEFNEHISDHKVLSGAHPCTECGETVVYQDLDENDRPTMSQIKNNLVFHKDCQSKFFKDRGFQVTKI